MLIPSLYATSLRTQSLRPVRVPSDQNTRWRLPHHFSPLRDKEFLVSPHLLDIYPLHLRVDNRRYAAHVRQKDPKHKKVIVLMQASTVLEQKSQIKHFKVSKANNTFPFWFTHSLPTDPVNLLLLNVLVPLESIKNRIQLFTNTLTGNLKTLIA